MLKKFFQQNLILLILFPLFLLIYHKWIFEFGVLTYTDWWYFSKETILSILANHYSLWLSDFSLGRVHLEIGQSPSYMAYAFFTKYFGFSYALNERIIHLWPIIIFTPLSIIILLSSLVKKKISIFVGTLAYCFNTYFLTIQTGHLTLMIVFAIAPLILFLYKICLEKQNLLFAVLSGLFLAVSMTYEPRASYIIYWILFIYFLYMCLFIEKKFTNIVKFCMYGLLPVAISLLLNFYWIFGLFKINVLSMNDLFVRQLFGNEFLNILYALNLYHPYWTGSLPKIFQLQPIPFYFWIIPLISFLGLILNRKNTNILFYGFILVLGILLTKQIGIPFSNLYLFLYNHLPGFSAFREASKFFFLIALGSSVLIASFVDKVWLSQKISKYFKYLVVILLTMLFLWNTRSLISREIGTMFVNKKIPNDYILLNKKIINDKEYYKIVSVPVFSRWSSYTLNHPELSISQLINSNWNFIQKNTIFPTNITEGEKVIIFLQSPHAEALFNMASIKYVVLPSEDKENNDSLFYDYGLKRQDYIDALSKIKFITKKNIGTKQLIIYENENFKPHIYMTNSIESITSFQSIAKINYKIISPTEYNFSVNNVRKSFYINFSESYHPDWKMRIGNLNLWDVMTKKNYFVSDRYHFKNDANLNSYFIDTKLVCEQFTCIHNSDGSYNISGKLYFAPQAYVYLGLIISGISFFTILIYLILIIGKNIYAKRKKT